MSEQKPSMRLLMVQMNAVVGDIAGNAERLISEIHKAEQNGGADVLVFPELCLTGYPPEDLLLRPSLCLRVEKALAAVQAAMPANTAAIIGYPRRLDGQLYNCAGVMSETGLLAEYRKQHLPNYRVFDEKRYFSPGDQACCVELAGHRVALSICEDIWHEEVMLQAKAEGAELMININASPFHVGKPAEREAMLAERAVAGGMAIAYTNLVGGQDELVFDGASLVLNRKGEVVQRASAFTEQQLPVSIIAGEPEPGSLAAREEDLAAMYQALVLGVRDYVNKNGFKGVVLGLSGGIDSALTLAVAADALGPERVEAVMMPFRYTADMSLEDAEAEANTLGVEYKVMSIEPMYDAFAATLADEFAGLPVDTTEQNIQARCRGVLLMAISNKKGYLVLTTGNKSEVGVGYSTLYGDMAGGFDVLKDVSKMRVYALSRYRNTLSPVIPVRVIERPPSAELAPDQKDEDSLPAYEILDQILSYYVEEDESAEAIIARGFDKTDVERVLRLVDINEYKRRQAPIGTRVTERGFGRDRRYPITNRWPLGE